MSTKKKRPTHIVSFSVTREESLIIDKIAKRGVKMAHAQGITIPFMNMSMDLCATHANGNPLRLTELLDADDFNFSHDVFGIRRHLDRETGQLTDCFVPRFSLRTA